MRHGRNWPGLRLAWPSKRTFARPQKFFRGEGVGGTWPKEAPLELARPPGYEELDDSELEAKIQRAINRREERARVKRDAAGLSFLGRAAIRRQRRHARPRSREPRFYASPQVACKDKWRRIERQSWRDDYVRALRAWRSGDRTAVFPAGAYKMRFLHDVRCAQAD